MTTTDKLDFFPAGFIVKPHGLKGEMILDIEAGLEDVLEDSDYLMVEVDGGLVPFFITEEGINFRTPTSLSLAFDDIDTAEKVRPYCGCKIYLPSGAAPLQESGTELNVLVGYNVFDRERGNLGEIIRVDDFSGNIVLTIEHGTKEIMVPLSEDLIVEYREEEKEIYLDCPEGLIDLYLE